MLIFGFVRAIQILLMILTIKISTILLSPYEMGRLSLIYSIVSFYILIFINPVGMFMNRRFHSWNLAGRIKNYMRFFWTYLIFVSFFSIIPIFILARFDFLIINGSLIYLLALVSGSLLITTANQVVIPNLNILESRILYLLLTLASTTASLIIAYLIATRAYPKAEYWLSGILIGQFLITIIGWKFFYSKINKSDDSVSNALLTKKHLREMFRFVWPILIGSGFMWVQTQGYRLAIVEMAGLANLGLFVAGYTISAGIVSSVESILSTYFLPNFYKKITSNQIKEQEQAWALYASGIFPVLILVGFLTAATAPELTRIFLGEAYRSSSAFLVWGVIVEILRVIGYVYGMVAHAKMETKLLIFPSIIGSFILILLIIFALPYWGINGVGPSLATAGAVFCISTFIAVRKNFTLLISFKLIGKCLLFGIFLVTLNYFFRKVIGLNYIFLLVISIILYLLMQYIVFRPHLKYLSKI
jgi:O-antigen/teichoic acid export membrane protein